MVGFVADVRSKGKEEQRGLRQVRRSPQGASKCWSDHRRGLEPWRRQRCLAAVPALSMVQAIAS